VVSGISEDLLGRSLFDEDARVEIDDLMSDVAREVHLVGGNQHGRALVGEVD
jgi:hypothetical protein